MVFEVIMMPVFINYYLSNLMQIDPSLLFSDQHLWTKPTDDGFWIAGITEYAQDLLGDIVFVDPPKLEQVLEAGKPCGLVESVKTGSDLHALVQGEVVEVNQDVLDDPELINDKPYEAWIFKFKTDEADLSTSLLNAEAYEALINAG
jgi:glycine cleavage system H protein